MGDAVLQPELLKTQMLPTMNLQSGWGRGRGAAQKVARSEGRRAPDEAEQIDRLLEEGDGTAHAGHFVDEEAAVVIRVDAGAELGHKESAAGHARPTRRPAPPVGPHAALTSDC